MNFTVYVNRTYCKGVEECGLCLHVCKKAVYEESGTLNERGVRPPEAVRPEDCTGCELCMIYCPDMAIVIEPESGRDPGETAGRTLPEPDNSSKSKSSGEKTD